MARGSRSSSRIARTDRIALALRLPRRIVRQRPMCAGPIDDRRAGRRSRARSQTGMASSSGRRSAAVPMEAMAAGLVRIDPGPSTIVSRVAFGASRSRPGFRARERLSCFAHRTTSCVSRSFRHRCLARRSPPQPRPACPRAQARGVAQHVRGPARDRARRSWAQIAGLTEWCARSGALLLRRSGAKALPFTHRSAEEILERPSPIS